MSARTLVDQMSAPTSRHRDRDVTMESHGSSKRASLDRQTGLASLKLVSKYYGYANYSYPRPEGKPGPNPYRRPGHSYTDLTQQPDATSIAQPSSATSCYFPSTQESQPPLSSPTYQRTFTRDQRDRASVGSEASTPSLIDDYTDSEYSHDDDYQYHTSTSQLWDSFWMAQEAEDTTTSEAHDPSPEQKTPKKKKAGDTTKYPALIPSPYIKRVKKSSAINYDKESLPPRPVDFDLCKRTSKELAESRKDVPQWPIRTSSTRKPTTAVTYSPTLTTTPEEKRNTIRSVKSSYSLFPQTSIPIYNSESPASPVTATTSVNDLSSSISSTFHLAPPPPRVSSHYRPDTPTSVASTTESKPLQRKPSRPQAVSHHSEPLIAKAESRQSSEMFQTRASNPLDLFPQPPPQVSGPAGVSTTLPMFPSANLADLAHPRAAPEPPCSATSSTFSHQHLSPSAAATPISPQFPSSEPPVIPALSHQKSFFDFDSDSESDTETRGISRIMKGRKHKHSRSSTSNAEPSTGRISPEVPRPSTSAGERMRRKSRMNLTNRRPQEDVERVSETEKRKLDGRKGQAGAVRRSDMFGRLFGRNKGL